jgi:hypothetical protein
MTFDEARLDCRHLRDFLRERSHRIRSRIEEFHLSILVASR